ncbi:hypothetical protein NL676_024830 [Syzygium grande]|nr:hypothetical protein NL676_024830 [Syzygium grande]
MTKILCNWKSTFVEESFSRGSLTMSKDQVSNGNKKDSSRQFRTPSPGLGPRAFLFGDNKLGPLTRDHQQTHNHEIVPQLLRGMIGGCWLELDPTTHNFGADKVEIEAAFDDDYPMLTIVK